MAILHINSRLTREMGTTLTRDKAGRQFSLVTAPEQELGEGLLHPVGPRLPGLTMAAKKG